MWRYLSWVRSACQAFTKQTMTATMYGGAVRRRVWILPYPRVSTTVGKKVVIEPDAVEPYMTSSNSHVLGSLDTC